MADTPTAVDAAHTLYGTLKDFQPLIAAGVAAFATVMAYLAQNIRVRFDRETRDSDRTIQALGVLLRLQAVANRTSKITQVISNTNQPSYEILAAMVPKMPQEFDDAWNQPTSIPTTAFEHLETARYFIEFWQMVIRQNTTLEGVNEKTRASIVESLVHGVKTVDDASEKLANSLDDRIKELRGKLKWDHAGF
jgi:hypothetical protein